MTNVTELAIIRHMLGDRLRQARTAARLTQQVAGDRIGVSRSAVAQWEGGGTNPSHENLVAAAAVYRVPTEWLLGNGDTLIPEHEEEGAICDRSLIKDMARALYQSLEDDDLVLDAQAFADLLIVAHDWASRLRSQGKPPDNDVVRDFLKAARARARTLPGSNE